MMGHGVPARPIRGQQDGRRSRRSRAPTSGSGLVSSRSRKRRPWGLTAANHKLLAVTRPSRRERARRRGPAGTFGSRAVCVGGPGPWVERVSSGRLALPSGDQELVDPGLDRALELLPLAASMRSLTRPCRSRCWLRSRAVFTSAGFLVTMAYSLMLCPPLSARRSACSRRGVGDDHAACRRTTPQPRPSRSPPVPEPEPDRCQPRTPPCGTGGEGAGDRNRGNQLLDDHPVSFLIPLLIGIDRAGGFGPRQLSNRRNMRCV